MRKRAKKREPITAAGDKEVLEAKATREEIKKGDYTKVVTLSYDEADPS